MFQSMGPAPSARSGHQLASVGTKVFVLGGEAVTQSQTDDASTVHVLETSVSWHSIEV